MKSVFADSSLWIAVLLSTDQYHRQAIRLLDDFAGLRIVTSDFVCLEILNFIAGHGSKSRAEAGNMVAALRLDFGFHVVPGSRDLFDNGLQMFRRMGDKRWSLVDCTSFVVMQDLGISEALTTDHHFEQAGFTILLK